MLVMRSRVSQDEDARRAIAMVRVAWRPARNIAFFAEKSLLRFIIENTSTTVVAPTREGTGRNTVWLIEEERESVNI
jgi:hypothetical protein